MLTAQSSQDKNNPDSDPITTTPSILFLADPNASTFLLADTVQTILIKYSIQRAYIDLTTLAGLTAAAELQKSGIAYESLNFGQNFPEISSMVKSENSANQPYPDFTAYPYLLQMSARARALYLDDLVDIDANMVLVPTITAEGLIDFSTDTLVGKMLSKAENAGDDVLVIVPPERGVYARKPERYERITVLVHSESKQVS